MSAIDVLKTSVGMSCGVKYTTVWGRPQDVTVGRPQDVGRRRPLALHEGPYGDVHRTFFGDVPRTSSGRNFAEWGDGF